MFAQRNLVKVYILSFLVLLAVSRCITLHCKVIWNDFVAPTLKLCSANPGGLNLCAFAQITLGIIGDIYVKCIQLQLFTE